jgi:hypothetical protein
LGILLSLVCLVGGAAMMLTNTSPGGNIDAHAGGLVLVGAGLIWLVLSAVIWDIGREADDDSDEVARQRIIYTGGARTPRRPSHHR